MPPKIQPRKRTIPRVTSTEPSRGKPRNSARHRQTEKPKTDKPKMEGFVNVVDGEIYISAQLSELAPVAQFANVTLGPVQIAWKLGNTDMEPLLEVDWDEIEDSDDIEKKLTKTQLATWTRCRQALRSSMMLLEFTIGEDRQIVERAVAEHNRQEEAEKKKGSNSR